jgi:hypothetical protein
MRESLSDEAPEKHAGDLIELLNELRVVLSGFQVLFAFLRRPVHRAVRSGHRNAESGLRGRPARDHPSHCAERILAAVLFATAWFAPPLSRPYDRWDNGFQVDTLREALESDELARLLE